MKTGGIAISIIGIALFAWHLIRVSSNPHYIGYASHQVMSINGVKVEVEVTGEKPAWVKKGGGIKLAEVKGGVGKIVDVSATTVVFNSKKASELKVGDKVTLEKGPAAPAGC